MKKLLIIQQDEAYFLFETLQTIEHHRDFLKDFELTLLVSSSALEKVQDGSVPIPSGTICDEQEVLRRKYDVSANLSLNESSWRLHALIQSQHKLGMTFSDGRLIVPDPWSTYLLTTKAGAPFLTFHLQDIYKNILGIRRIPELEKRKQRVFHEVVFGLFNPDFFPAQEQEKLLDLISSEFPTIRVKDLSEMDFISDLSHVIYIGPTSLDALKLCEAGAKGIFIGSHFQGFNLLPKEEGHYFLSTKNQKASSAEVHKFFKCLLSETKIADDIGYAVYQIDEENLFGSFLKSANSSDDQYPVYQGHVVLWNFILNLFDTNLEVPQCTDSQVKLLKSQSEVLSKLIRLYDYGMTSIDVIHQQSKALQADGELIQGHMRNLQEIEEITDKISQSHSLLRPFLDFYRIRRGQNGGNNLFDQSQDSFLLYAEEHQCLKALLELFTVTLHRNEASI